MNVSVEDTDSMLRIFSEISSSRCSSLSHDRLDEEVVGPGGDHDVVDLGQRGQRVGDRLQRALDPDADHRLAGEAELERVGDRDDLHDAGVEQPLDPLADRGLGQADDLADGCVGTPAVLLQLLDDGLRDVIEVRAFPVAWSLGHPGIVSGRGGRDKIRHVTKEFVASMLRTD